MSDENPRRLVDEQRPAGGLLREVAARTAADPQEARAWQRLTATPPSSSAGPRWVLAAAIISGLLAFAGWRLARPPAAVPPPPPVAAVAPPKAAPPRIALTPAELTLAAPAVDLDGEAIAELGAATRASASRSGAVTDVKLGAGDVKLTVAPRRAGHSFQVSAGPYRFSVVGTVFRVARDGTQVELWVSEGTVEVSQSTGRLARIEAGGHWAGPLELPAPAAQKPAARPDPHAERCADRPAADALGCYQRLARGEGLPALTACYEAGRLQRDSLRDDRGAVETFTSCRARFPGSALDPELEVSILELLPRVGRFREALEQSEKLLAAHPAGSRVGQLRLLRGNLYREALGDCGNARHEYQLAVEAGGRAADEALFLHAVCLEALGQRAQAAAEYQRYLEHGALPRQAEARQRLEKMKGP